MRDGSGGGRAVEGQGGGAAEGGGCECDAYAGEHGDLGDGVCGRGEGGRYDQGGLPGICGTRVYMRRMRVLQRGEI